MFAEDEVQQLKLVQALLEAEGYCVLATRDGVEAVELYRRYKNDIPLAILDIRMPNVNGRDAIREMKAVPS